MQWLVDTFLYLGVTCTCYLLQVTASQSTQTTYEASQAVTHVLRTRPNGHRICPPIQRTGSTARTPPASRPTAAGSRGRYCFYNKSAVQPLIPSDVQYRRRRQFLISGIGLARRDTGVKPADRAARARGLLPRRDALRWIETHRGTSPREICSA